MNAQFWNGKSVLVTGHTGFKGAWLALWLQQLGAKVSGISLEPEFSPGLLEQFQLTPAIKHHIQDIRDAAAIQRLVTELAPDVIFHLAAQPLVRRSYRAPVDTWSTNVFGTINVMEALRGFNQPVVAVMVTTDKVYQNREWPYGYREVDPVGGHDPYSSSKAAMEIAVESWRKSFFGDSSRVAIATARAGNVIGGGDFAEDRIVPDIVRHLRANKRIAVRNPRSTRPWQHVLEPLSGYLKLAERIHDAQGRQHTEMLAKLCSSWNFGPLPEANRTVEQLVETALQSWPGGWDDHSTGSEPHEAGFLGLAIDKAVRYIDWYPCWSFADAVKMTIQWYREVQSGACPRAYSIAQIQQYQCGSRA